MSGQEEKEHLLPCPFCGGTVLRVTKDLRDGYDGFRDDPDAYARYVRCLSCGAAGGWSKRKGNAIRLWNTRIGGDRGR